MQNAPPTHTDASGHRHGGAEGRDLRERPDYGAARGGTEPRPGCGQARVRRKAAREAHDGRAPSHTVAAVNRPGPGAGCRVT